MTRSTVDHAGVHVGDGRIVEAQPEGATFKTVHAYPAAIWSRPPANAQAVADAAVALRGTPYSRVDVGYIGLTDLFARHDPQWVRVRLHRRTRLMCSQPVDTAYLNAGDHLFNDGRVSGDVGPKICTPSLSPNRGAPPCLTSRSGG